MTTARLRPTAFRGDVDVDDLHAFFQPELQYSGDTLWTFGTSLKSAYVNTFEFMNHAPVVQLWRGDDDSVQAVSRISLGTGEWFHLAAPDHRNPQVTKAMITQANAAFELLTERPSWTSVRYGTAMAEIDLLEAAGYTNDGVAEVFMTRSLAPPPESPGAIHGTEIMLLDPDDSAQVHERALAQVDAFTPGKPTAAETAWITRSLPHQLSYGRPDPCPSVIAVDRHGTILAFADFFVDATNLIGELEPVGTRTSARHRGLAHAVTSRALREMRDRGMTQAVVRTGADNLPAIAAYESVGFETTDHLIRFRRYREPLSEPVNARERSSSRKEPTSLTRERP